MNQKIHMQLEQLFHVFGLFLILVCSHEAAERAEGWAEHAGEEHRSRPVDILYCTLHTIEVPALHCSLVSLLLGGEDKHGCKALTSAVAMKGLLDELFSR